MSELIRKSRSKFRAERGISEDKYIIYIDAGNNAHQVKFSFNSFKNGLSNFLSNPSISSINPSHFEIFVNIPSNVIESSYRMLQNRSRVNLGSFPTTLRSHSLMQKINMVLCQQLTLDFFTMDKPRLRQQPCSSPVWLSTA